MPWHFDDVILVREVIVLGEGALFYLAIIFFLLKDRSFTVKKYFQMWIRKRKGRNVYIEKYIKAST